MMQGIFLFRGKRSDNGEWIRGRYIYSFDHTTQKKKHYINLSGNPNDMSLADLCEYEVKPKTIDQCTGLRDKNGKLIFERDIVNLSKNEDKSIVYWAREFWYFKIDGYYERLYNYANTCEIIGNVHDNPELLKR